MTLDPSLVPDVVSIRDFGPAAATGESQYMRELYVRRRGDANIRNARDMTVKAHNITDPRFLDVTTSPNGRGGRADAKEMDMADRMLQRFAFQQTVLQCMAEQHLDALVYPTMNVPELKIQEPEEPEVNSREYVSLDGVRPAGLSRR